MMLLHRKKSNILCTFDITLAFLQCDLKAVNKNIRQVEIDVLEKQRLVSLEELSKASWRLDSLRVIVTNKE